VPVYLREGGVHFANDEIPQSRGTIKINSLDTDVFEGT
jgi:hypothetical protein